jgi:twinkle protein
LEDLISKDFTIVGRGRWLRTQEHDSLVIDSENQFWHWNGKHLCGNIFTWLTKIKGYTYKQAKEYLKNIENYQDTFVHVLNGNHDEVLVYPKLIDVFYENGKLNPRDYWYKRAIHDTTIDMFKLGFYDGWYTIPIFMDGAFRNFQIRREEPEKKIESWYKGVGPLLFNSDILKLVDYVYLTEGPTDALVLLEQGLPAVSHNAGSECFLDYWFKYFIRQKLIYILYDNDEAGEKGARTVAKVLGENRCKIYTFGGYSDKYDVGDFFSNGGVKEDFKNLVETKSKFLYEI